MNSILMKIRALLVRMKLGGLLWLVRLMLLGEGDGRAWLGLWLTLRLSRCWSRASWVEWEGPFAH